MAPRDRTVPTWWVPSIGLTLLCASCATGVPPEGWPTRRELIRQTRSNAPERRELDAVVVALREANVDLLPPCSPRLNRILGEDLGRQRFAEASARLRALGPWRGSAVTIDHAEPSWTWVTSLGVFGRGRTATPIVIRMAFDPQGDLDRIVVQRQLWSEELRTATADRLPLHRFVWPLEGTWDVLQGGDDPDENGHYGHPEQHFAVDLVVRERGRVRPVGDDVNEAHYAYGQLVRAPAPGIVVRVIDGVEERAPGQPGSGGGNGVILDHGFGEYSAMWHFVPGSIVVAPGQHVQSGDALGKVGNSGASTLPHLHWHLASGYGELERIALPMWIEDVIVDGRPQRRVRPQQDQRVAADPAPPAPLGASGPPDPPAIWLDL